MIYATREIEIKMKRLFAQALMRRPTEPFNAAREIEFEQPRYLQMGAQWPNDLEVMEIQRELLAMRGPLAQVPTKEEFAATVWKEVNELSDKKEKLQYMIFFAKVMGYSEEKAQAGINLNFNGPKIMAVPIAASDQEWEKHAQAHSKTLMAQHG